ncbi:Uncharacterized protein Adt_36828 [Abeliophyllum distichum]|uniref:Uncharacterized protein n=1 Tax=Abeliophyllum distichum TaxID=126358 RepID=A0ABD1QJY4_9LAMI
MASAKLVQLKFIILVCLSVCSANKVKTDSKNEKPNHVSSSQMRIAKMAARVGGSFNSTTSSVDHGGSVPRGDCGGGLGFYGDNDGPESCCCESCGLGLGPKPGQLHGEIHLDPDRDSCCQIDKRASDSSDPNSTWICCNCPDGIWIETRRWAYKRPHNRPTQINLDKLATKASKPNKKRHNNLPRSSIEKKAH